MFRTSTLTLAAASFASPASQAAQAGDVDQSPVFYVMLKNLERRFEHYVEEIDTQGATLKARLEREFHTATARQAQQATALQERQKAAWADLGERQRTLNARVSKMNEDIERFVAALDDLKTTNRDALLRLENERAGAVDRVRDLQSGYRELAKAAAEASATLREANLRVESQRDPDADTMRRIGDDFNRKAEAANRALAQASTAHQQAVAEFQAWIAAQNAILSELQRANTHLREGHAETAAAHRELTEQLQVRVDRYNRLVEERNTDALAAAKVEALQAELTELALAIEADRLELGRLEAKAASTSAAVESGEVKLRDRHRQILDEKARRTQRIKQSGAELGANQERITAELGAARDASLTAITEHREALESRLRDYREAFQLANQALTGWYGKDHPDVYEAAAAWLSSGEMEPLRAVLEANPPASQEEGTARAELQSAAQLAGDLERRIRDELRSAATRQSQRRALEEQSTAIARQRNAIEADRQGLAADDARTRRVIAAAATELRAKTLALEQAQARRANVLGDYLSAQRELAILEFSILQAALVAAAGLDARPVDPTPWADLAGRLTRGSAALPDLELSPETHWVLSQLEARLPVSPPATDGGDTGLTDRWVTYSAAEADEAGQPSVLSARNQAAVIWTWFQRVKGKTWLAGRLANGLAQTSLGGRGLLERYLRALFLDGMGSEVTFNRHPLPAGQAALSVTILGNEWWLDPDGRLARPVESPQ